MIFYINGAKNSIKTDAAMVRFFNVKTKAKNWNLEGYIDVIHAKLIAIEKAIKLCAKKAYSIKIELDIWTFTDCANTITRLEDFEFRTHLIKKLHRNCKELYGIDQKIHIYWISKHAKISGNLQADEQIKKGLKKIKEAPGRPPGAREKRDA